MIAKSDTDACRLCLTALREVIPYRYAQWLIEDQDNHDYLVIASVTPAGKVGYSTAHRTGIIGQVFRIEKSVFAPDVSSHPLYDPFDEAINWELTFPVFLDGNLQAVVNFEGGGSLEIDADTWERVCRVVEETTQCHPPLSAPDANTSPFIKTRRMVIRADDATNGHSDIVQMARAIARGGESTLLVGNYPDLLCGRGPTLAEGREEGLGPSYCYFGVDKRLDLLATGAMTQDLGGYYADWWDTCRGRYAVVLLRDDSLTVSNL